MEYNTTRPELVIPEYGRNIQSMIEHLKTIEDREARSRAAHFVIEIMAQMNPHLKDAADYKHKLWDHLHLISNFELDVDSPYEKPSAAVLQKRPDHIGYNSGNLKYGHYGRHLVEMIRKVSAYDDGPEKDELVRYIANQMKKSYLTWNRDSVNDSTIAENLEALSDGLLTLDEDTKLIATNEVIAKSKKKKQGPRRDQGQQRKGHHRSR